MIMLEHALSVILQSALPVLQALLVVVLVLRRQIEEQLLRVPVTLATLTTLAHVPLVIINVPLVHLVS